jgi:hypothetical protein
MLLPPLDAGAVAALAGSIVGPGLDSRVAAGLQARTGGNPFFAHEVARLIAARGPAAAVMVPPGVREVLERPLARLSQPCVSLLAELYRDAARGDRYLTIDRWQDEKDWRSFLRAFGSAYEFLDAQLEGLAVAERSLFEGFS